MKPQLDEIAEIIDRHATAPISDCALPRVTLIRANALQDAQREMLVPVVCLVVRGAKIVQLGSRLLTFVPGTFVVSAVDFPITGQVVEVPYRAAAVHLSSAIMADLALAAKPVETASPSTGFSTGTASPEIVDAMARLVRLLDNAQDRAVLADAAERELLYRVLQTPLGHIVRQIALEGHIVSRIEPAISWIREHPAAHLSVETLARQSNLSASSLYRHFKAATGSTPLQFQKQLRLQDARRLLLTGETNATGAARKAGYLNPAQFHREYVRLFGTTPGRDAKPHPRSAVGD